jgi:hypothetical protein
MSQNYKANPTVAPLISRPGESSEYVGARSVMNLLPNIFNTPVNKKFLESTLDQLMSSGSLQAINHYLGHEDSRISIDDLYLDDNRTSDQYQFVPGVINKDDNGNVTDVISYDDIINGLRFGGATVEQPNRLLNEPAYTLDLPINYDMFINYHRYFWLLDFLPVCEINATVGNPITIANIVGQISYTTPTLSNSKTLEFRNGMRVAFKTNCTGNVTYPVDDIYIVEGVGQPTGIKLIRQYDDSAAETTFVTNTIYVLTRNDDSETPADIQDDRIIVRDYVVERRDSIDQSAWARSNAWVRDDVAIEVCEFNSEDPFDYIVEPFRAIRPIIEYRANIEKYNYGKQHLTSVTHMFDSISNPLTAIVGQSTWNLAAHSITVEWDLIGYNKGDQVKVTVGGNVTYWDCVQSHTNGKNPTFFENRIYWREVSAKLLVNGDTILFANNATSTYNKKIFRVSGVGSSIALTEIFNTTNYSLYDKVIVKIGYNNVFGDSTDSLIYAGSEWYWDGTNWIYGQQKDSRSVAPKFNLYDHEQVLLSDTTTYPNTTFEGDTIFDYARTSGVVDYALGFAPRYVDYGNNPGYEFDFGLGAKRYDYNNINENTGYQADSDVSTIEVIKGYYYYKNLDTGLYYNGWVQLRGDQPIEKHIRYTVTSIESDHVFDIGTTNINLDNKFKFKLSNGGNLKVYSENTLNERDKPELINGINPALFMSKGRTYIVQTMFDITDFELVNVDGSAISTGLTVTSTSTNTQTIAISSSIAIDYIKYRLVSDNTVFGIIYLDANTSSKNLTVKINGVESDDYTLSGTRVTVENIYPLDTIIEISWSSYDILTSDQGIFHTADTHVYNPQNEWLTNATFGDLQAHIKSQMSNIPGFSGDYFGSNNYTQLPQIHEFGGTIRQQPFSTELLAVTLDDENTNPFASLKFIANSYAKFRQQLLRKTTQLHYTQPIDVPMYKLVDMALDQLNLGKTNNSPFAYSNVLLYRDFKEVEYVWVTGDDKIFDLPETINKYSDLENHVHVYVYDLDGGAAEPYWRPLVKGSDYSFDNKKKINISDSFTADVNGKVKVLIRWFPIDSVSFFPPSAVTLGLSTPYYPQILSNFDPDGAGPSGNDAIIGHDGAVYVLLNTDIANRDSASFDIEGATIWELETRIFNNLSLNGSNVIDYLEAMPNASRKTPYTWHELNAAMESEFNSWKIRNAITSLNDETFYNSLNEFTWNYSSITPYIGGWKGIYHYYFNTDRPHTHPWEMLGYKQKPLWWDTYYTWLSTANGGNDAKRTALIEALKTGHYNNPAESDKKYDITYCYSAFNWSSNVIVTTAGILNGPVTAGIVTAPTTAEKQKEFVYGDWGPVEARWRRSSEYNINRALGLLRLRPLWLLNSYFDSNNRKFDYHPLVATPQVLFEDTGLIGNNTNPKLSYRKYEDSIIELINVRHGGAGYTSNTRIEIYGNFGSGATAEAIVEDGSIIAVTITNPGSNYQSKPTIVAVDDTATITEEASFEAILSSDVRRYYSGVSNAVIEFGVFNTVKIDSIIEKFETAMYNPVIKIGGFINKANQRFVLDSSQDKGKVTIPEENYVVSLYKSQPIFDTFYGAIKITLTDEGYMISGYDTSKMYLEYNPVSYNSKKTIVPIGNTNIIKYKEFTSDVVRLEYNTVLVKEQDVYDIVRGYGHYLNTFGWIPNWDTAATTFLSWTEDSPTIGDIINVIPATDSIEISEGVTGYFDNLQNKYDGVYNLIDQNGRQVLPNKVIVERQVLEQADAVTKITPKSSDLTLYGIRMYSVELEHVVVFENYTGFDDVIYNPALGQLHARIKWIGSRTKNWNGKLYAPGYIVDNNTIYNNFDRTVADIDQIYDVGNNIVNNSVKNAARSNIGYNTPSWKQYTTLDDNTVFEFVKGIGKYKGTKYALNAFLRNTSIFGTQADVSLFEEWAIRTADYGDTRSRDTVEFNVNKDLVLTSPQVIRLRDTNESDALSDVYIDITPNSELLVTGTVGNNFQTRLPKVFSYDTLSAESPYKNDFITSGTPLTTETDYRVLDYAAFAMFPEQESNYYDFSGSWQDIKQWDNKTSYKYGDRVIYQGRVWEMVDANSSTGLTTPNDPIIVTGTISLPVVANGRTLILDGNTITFNNSTTSTTSTTVSVTGTNDISTTNVVTSGSTLVLGATSATAETIVFSNTASSTTYNNIVVTGNVINPTFVGSSTEKLTIDSIDVLFNQTTSTTTNITAQAAFENAFNSWVINNTTGLKLSAANARISAIENLRSAYTGTWSTFLSSYFSSSVSGINISLLLSEIAATPSYQTQVEALLDSDITLINNYANKTYITANVIAGSETVLAGDITTAQTLMAAGTYTEDVKDWLVANTSTAFTTSTVVFTSSGTTFVTYTITDIVNRINSASIPNVTASNSAGSLRLTKTTITPATQFSLVIASASANSDVGLDAGTYVSGSSTSTTTPNLSIAQVISQINAAGISGITAAALAPTGILLTISSTNSSLYIGNGTANSVIGLTTGVTAATSTVTTVNISSYINDIVTQVNLANISGVRAANSNNRVKITSTNPTLIIGAGTANSDIGFTAQTYTATQTTVSNIFEAIVDGEVIFRRMDYDPNVFSIWIAKWKADELTSSQINSDVGFAAYQTMDMGWYITRACAGIDAADDAQLTIATPSGAAAAHSLQVGDFVLIRGSNTEPNIDGIHRVTGIDTNNTNKFFIDVYINKEGNVGNVYPIRNVRFSSYQDLLANYNSTNAANMYYYNFAGYRQNTTTRPIYVFVDRISDVKPVSGVYKFYGSFSTVTGHNGSWQLVREGNEQARNDLLENVKVYDAINKTLITTIETFDPAKGILPGFIDNEIDFATTADFAVYNYDSVNGNSESRKTWGADQLGLRWWDLNTAIYLDYEQGPLDYQQNNWGRLFDGASVDIYEWTESTVLPDQWEQLVKANATVNGRRITGEVYKVKNNDEYIYYWTEASILDPVQNRTKTVYYFWVKNKLDTVGNRVYNTKQLSNYLTNPNSFEQLWAAASQSSNLLINNLDKVVGDNTVVQINQIVESDALPLSEWVLLHDSDPVELIPEQLHIKMRDSIVGWNNAVKRYSYTNYNSLTTYSIDDVVIDGSGRYYISLKNSNLNHTPSADTAMTYWRRIYEYELPADTPADDIDVWMGQPLPDLNLHPFNRYGHLTRPNQSLVRDLKTARQNFVYAANDLLSRICIINEIPDWDTIFEEIITDGVIDYDMDKYWIYSDWYRKEYNNDGSLLSVFDKSILPDLYVDIKQELIPELGEDPLSTEEGTLVYVKTALHSDGVNRPEIYKLVNDEWVIQWKSKGTIQLSEELWNLEKFGYGFDVGPFDMSGFDAEPSPVIKAIFDLLRNKVFVGQYKSYYNKLWFKCLYHSVTDNATDDFAFKTTYAKIRIEHPVLTNAINYQPSGTEIVEEFFNSIKPYHTKLHSIDRAVTHMDENDIEVTELDLDSEITLRYNSHGVKDYEDFDEILTGGTFTSVVTNTDSSTFTTLDAALEYIYDGNGFNTVVRDNWGDELYPIDYSENIRIRVQTNSSGSTVTSDTRTFDMVYYSPYQIEESTVVVDTAKTTLSSSISATSTSIAVINALVLAAPVTGQFGVVWIDNERIEYRAIEGNTLRYCTRGTLGTSATTHASGATVTDASWVYKIPTLEHFIDYGNDLGFAYNDTGISLSATGTTPMHIFIRNAGSGTL